MPDWVTEQAMADRGALLPVGSKSQSTKEAATARSLSAAQRRHFKLPPLDADQYVEHSLNYSSFSHGNPGGNAYKSVSLPALALKRGSPASSLPALAARRGLPAAMVDPLERLGCQARFPPLLPPPAACRRSRRLAPSLPAFPAEVHQPGLLRLHRARQRREPGPVQVPPTQPKLHARQGARRWRVGLGLNCR